MDSFTLLLCFAAAVFYSGEMVTQERKLPDVSPIIVTFVLGLGIMLYGFPVVVVHACTGSLKWPTDWEWVLLFAIPILAFLADWAHFTSIHVRTGSVVLATMYMAIPMFASMLKLEAPGLLRCVAWLLTACSLLILVKGRIFAESEEEYANSELPSKKWVMLGVAMAVIATFLYSAEIVVQDTFLSHISPSILAMAGGCSTTFYAGVIITYKQFKGEKLRYPQQKEWKWAILIPVLSFIADWTHFGALHDQAGSVMLAMFYMTCPIWATFMLLKKPTKWHFQAWLLAAAGIILIIL